MPSAQSIAHRRPRLRLPPSTLSSLRPLMEELGNIFVSVLQQCQQRNMPLPYLFVAVAINGGLLGARYLRRKAVRGLRQKCLLSTHLAG